MKKICRLAGLMLLSMGLLASCSDDGNNNEEAKCDGNGQVKSADGVCLCNAAEGYVMTNDGSCATGTGCNAWKENYNDATSLCECNPLRHWAGASGNCYCSTGFEEKDNVCVPQA